MRLNLEYFETLTTKVADVLALINKKSEINRFEISFFNGIMMLDFCMNRGEINFEDSFSR